MRGSIKWQVNEVFKVISKIGHSKHLDKEIARNSGAKTWHDVGKNIGIYSYRTLDVYRDVAKQLMSYVKLEFGIKDIERLTGEHVKSFLEYKMEQGVTFSTFQQYAAACEKLEVALNRYSEVNDRGNYYSFESDLKQVREVAKDVLEKTNPVRAYENPKDLIKNLTENEHFLIAKLQYEAGARLHEASLIKRDQLKGLDKDSFTGREIGKIGVQGKGGYVRDINVSADTYRHLENHIKENGVFKVDKDAYRADLKFAAEKSQQDYTGSHGLRWNFAQERFNELQEKGNLTYEQALKQVSEEMGHHRADITEHYLKK
jgi:site-specific recombinase XerC